MFAPAKRKYFNPLEDSLKVGDIWKIDSGLGGSFDVKIVSIGQENLIVNIITPEWKGVRKIERSRIESKLFKLIPV